MGFFGKSREEKVLAAAKAAAGKLIPYFEPFLRKDTLEKSIECLQMIGMMVSFVNSSGALSNIDIKKMIQPKSLFFTRPTMFHYLSTRNELNEGAEKLFEKIKLGKIKVEIFKKYKLENVVQAHKDLEARTIIGPAIIVP